MDITANTISLFKVQDLIAALTPCRVQATDKTIKLPFDT